MGLLSKLFGSDKVIDAGIDGIDKMIFTDEEKSNAKLLFLKLYEPYKLAQRYIAIIFCPTYAFAWMATFGIEVADIFIEKNLNTDVLYKLLSGDFALIVFTIIAFYFGCGAVEGVVSRFKGK